MSEITNNGPDLLHNFLLFEYDEVKPSRSSDGIVTMKGIIQKATEPNANNRIYPRPILEREDNKFQELIHERRALGELDHPDSPIVQLENVSHLVTGTSWEGDDLIGEIEVLDTPKGQILGKLVERKIKLGISSRGLGSTSRTNEGHDVVEDDFNLVTYDMVSNPSTSNAYMHLKESKDYKIVMAQNRILNLNGILDEILGL
ncbi:hypothetical protein HN803_03005 [candidate division WWE3 bacterium]|jgi:hypothetical protein|nr:hypothetical protein [candidate division WWE3 bacterium]